MKTRLVVFLHGVGSQGDDLAPLAELWAATLPDAAFEAPDAPEQFGGGATGRQWFSIAGVTPGNRLARVAAARPAFDALIQRLLEKHGLRDRLDHVAFVGFSQGSIMALDAVATGRWPVAAAVAYSGRLPGEPSPGASPDTNVLLIHGSGDPVIPVTESVRAETLLNRAGIQAGIEVIQGLGHTISQEGAALGGDFLAQRLG